MMKACRLHTALILMMISGLIMEVCCGCGGRPRLETIVYGGKGPPTFVLLHGYGSTPEEWMQFTNTISLPKGGRFIFPRGPEVTVPPDGPVNGRAWWRLDLTSYILPGQKIPDLSASSPEGIKIAAELVVDLLQRLKPSSENKIILGGFSQGAMVASQVAFLSDQRISALVLFSGTIIDELLWDKKYSLRRGLPVFISHGRSDTMLPFSVAERFQKKMATAGLAVTWCPFEGGHDIPEEVVVRLNTFIADLHLSGNKTE
jgi:phospholipase/carboxylesterase